MEGREGRKMENLGWSETDQVCGACGGGLRRKEISVGLGGQLQPRD